MANAEVRHIFNISADQLWDLIGDFGNTPKRSGSSPEACVQQGEVIGSLRTLTFEGNQKIVDRLNEMGERSYSYSLVSSPLPVSAYQA